MIFYPFKRIFFKRGKAKCNSLESILPKTNYVVFGVFKYNWGYLYIDVKRVDPIPLGSV